MTTSNEPHIKGYLIEQTAKRLKRAFQQTLAEMKADITADQWVVLDVVRHHQGLSQQEIGEMTAKDRPTVTRILDKLVDKALVERNADPGDRRKFGINTTQLGEAKVKTLLPQIMAFRKTHFRGIDREELNTLVQIMHKINANITKAQ